MAVKVLYYHFLADCEMTASSSFIYILYLHNSWLLQLFDLTSLLTGCWSLDLKWFEKWKRFEVKWFRLVRDQRTETDCSPATRWHCSFMWNEMIPTIPTSTYRSILTITIGHLLNMSQSRGDIKIRIWISGEFSGNAKPAWKSISSS